METDEVSSIEENKVDFDNKKSSEFKKPVLIGRVGKLPRKIEKIYTKHSESNEDEITEFTHSETSSSDTPRTGNNEELKKKLKEHLSPAELLKEQLPLPYKEPKWSGLPPKGIKIKI